MSRYFRSSRKAFTLIELLVVISIIGVLSTLAVISTVRARALAQHNKALGDLKQIRTAITLLESDNGKWPNGCRPNQVANPEVLITGVQAGLLASPVVGDQGNGCFWSAKDVQNWTGPYLNIAQDPWSHDYWFDPDYVPYDNCATKTVQPQTVAVLSFGPNGGALNGYDCDDIFLPIR
jgi:prepilin-type N-terminal cleavage/methylation domain-containing protein